ncbi:MAG: hypothetical protein MK200_06095 [Nitrosopumilus sp.]|nr:hypothetical protein [Nitrosopumilus sp.]
MKLSKHTLNMLKNFSDINMSIEIKKGNVLRTVSVQKNILAQAELEDEFPKDFAIYELNRFLGAVSLFDDPEFEFNAKSTNIGTTKHSVDYVYCDPSMIVTPPENNINFPDPEVKFTLTQESLSQVMRASNVLGTPEIAIEGDAGIINIKALDVNNDSTDTFKVVLDEKTDDKFRFVFKTENMKMIPGNYDVEISSKGISHFSLQGAKLQYWIATESTSNFGG